MEVDSIRSSSSSSSSHNSSCAGPKSLTNSLGDQFGFAASLVGSTLEVAPADKLFYKGWLLPLNQLVHRRNLTAQALTSASDGDGPIRLTWCTDDDDKECIETFNLCNMAKIRSTPAFEVAGDDDNEWQSRNMILSPLIMSARDLQWSSSFQSEQSTFWESSTEKGSTSTSTSCTRDSSASSSRRHSDGSSHDTQYVCSVSNYIQYRAGSRRREPTIDLVNPRLGSMITTGLNATMKVPNNGGVLNVVDEIDIHEGHHIRRLKHAGASIFRERWRELYARLNLKPLIEMKRGLMGRFRINDCGNSASCEVKSASIRTYSRSRNRPRPLQVRRLSHQSSLLKSHKHQAAGACQGRYGDVMPSTTGNGTNMAAMSSCPASSRSSSTHSGVLAAINCGKGAAHIKNSQSFTKRGMCSTSVIKDTRAILSTYKGSNSSKNKPGRDAFVHDHGKHTNPSVMHIEIHSAVQNAIAHCKESYLSKHNQSA